MAATEAIAVALGAVYIVLAIRQHRACWIAGGASTALYFSVFYQAGLPFQAALQPLYVALSVYGWVQWRPDSPQPAEPRNWTASGQLLALAAVVAVSLAGATLAGKFALSVAPLADVLGTSASVVATWLLARRYVETWLWWIVIDVALATLFASRGLGPTAVLYLGYAVLAFVGWRAWRHSISPQADPRIAAIVGELDLGRPVITRLDGGEANRSLRIKEGRHDVVLRLATIAGSALGADPEAECAMQALAAAHGLAPEILIARPREGILVTHHVAGHTLAGKDLQRPATLHRIGGWMARLHALQPPPLPAIDFGARAAGYLHWLDAREPDARLQRFAERLAARRAALPPPARLTACHHDLHRRNLLEAGGRLVAVDWEYAGPGDAAADLASCIGYNELGPPQVAALLQGYGNDDAALRERIEALAWIFTCLCFGWSAVAQRSGLAIDRATLARLAARLDA